MTVENILNAMGKINDEAVKDARTYKRTRFSKVAKWGAMAACLCLILTTAMVTLPDILKEPGGVVPPPNPAPGPVSSGKEDQPDDHSLPVSNEQNIVINWDNVIVNESIGMASDASRLYPDPALYEKEIWGQKEIKDYYGWELNVPYIPDGLTDGGNVAAATVYRDKSTGELIEDQVSRGFWVDFWEDGRPKSDDDIVIPKGFTITVSKLGILHCCLLPVDEERTTDFGGVNVIITHCSMKHGPFDPTQKAPDGLSNMPAGYYDIYVASFTLDGVEYEMETQRLELEEVIKIVASVINVPYSEDFIVGNS